MNETGKLYKNEIYTKNRSKIYFDVIHYSTILNNNTNDIVCSCFSFSFCAIRERKTFLGIYHNPKLATKCLAGWLLEIQRLDLTININTPQAISYKHFSNAKVLLQTIQIHRFLTNHFQKTFEGLFFRRKNIQSLHQAL